MAATLLAVLRLVVDPWRSVSECYELGRRKALLGLVCIISVCTLRLAVDGCYKGVGSLEETPW